MATPRPTRRAKRLLSITEEPPRKKSADNLDEVSPSLERSVSPNNKDQQLSTFTNEDSLSSHQQHELASRDIRDSVPYFLPPPPPPAFIQQLQDGYNNNNNTVPYTPMFDPMMGFVPMPYPHHHSPPMMIPPRPMPMLQPLAIPARFRAAITGIENDIPAERRNGSLEALAELSGAIGKDLDTSDFKSINKLLLDRQYQKAMDITNRLSDFFKSINNESEKTIESVTFDVVNDNYTAAKNLAEILRDWKDVLESNQNDAEEASLSLTSSSESTIFGLSDPNITLVLPPYHPTIEKKSKSQPIKLSELPSTDTAVPTLKDMKLPYGKCDQCEVEETIQWRRGPNGERSVCNACGLFYNKLLRKIGADLAGQVLAQRKLAGYPNDRRVPSILLGDSQVPYYVVQEVGKGVKVEVHVKDLGKLDCFDDSVDPPKLIRKVMLIPLLEKMAEVVLDVSNMNSKYDPSHDIKELN